MSILNSPYHLFINDFQSRFHTIKKIDDLFSRGYVLALDYQINKRAILKYYAIETSDQEQAVLENMSNFQKLNQVSGICKLLAYAISENKTQLLSAFQYDPLSLGEFVQKVKQINLDKYHRVSIYLDILQQTLKIISTSVEIGVQLDDINRQTIIIQQNTKNIQPFHQQISLPSEIEQRNTQSMYVCSILYDERQKQYNKIQNNQCVMNNGNKLYWSVEKIENQVLRGNEFCTQYGEQSVYQLGLLMLDIAYEIEKYCRSVDSAQTIINGVTQQEQLKPDEIAIYPQTRASYYTIQKQNKTITRNQILISHRLNFLISSDFESLKQFGIMIKNMICLTAQSRSSLNKIINDHKKIQQNHKRDMQNAKDRMRPSPELVLRVSHKQVKTKDQDISPIEIFQKNMQKKPTQPFKSLEEISEEPVYLQGAQTMKNINTQLSNQISVDDFHMDSLKYSENSSPNHMIEGSPTNSSSNPLKHIALIQSQENGIKTENLKSIRVNSNDDHLSDSNKKNDFNLQNNGQIQGLQGKTDSKLSLRQNSSNGKKITIQQQSEKNQIIGQQLLSFSKNHSQQLKGSFNSTISQLNQIRKQHPQMVIRKEYFDGSVYYGCIDLISKKRFGLGIYIYKSGDVYFGIWKDNTLSNGTYLFKNGESFEGTVKDGKQGLGIYRYNNGNVYNGMWKDDLKNGRGVMTYPNGAKYEGQWLKGKKHGDGSYFYESGIVYQGGFNLGKKYGNGVFQFPNGTRIEGFWDNNHLEGFVKVYYHNGDYYEGNFHMSEKSGEGTYRWNEQQQEGEIQYKGEFKKDHLEGFAIVKFRNGQIYEGKVKNGKRNGQGSYKYTNGDQFKGEWKNDEKQMGKYTFISGDQFQGKFKDGQMTFGTLKYVNGQIYQGELNKGYRHGVGTYSNKVGQLVHEGYWEKDQFMLNKKY